MNTTTSGTIIHPVKVSTYQKPLPWLEPEETVAGLLFTTVSVSLCTWCSSVLTLRSRSIRPGTAWPPTTVSGTLHESSQRLSPCTNPKPTRNPCTGVGCYYSIPSQDAWHKRYQITNSGIDAHVHRDSYCATGAPWRFEVGSDGGIPLWPEPPWRTATLCTIPPISPSPPSPLLRAADGWGGGSVGSRVILSGTFRTHRGVWHFHVHEDQIITFIGLYLPPPPGGSRPAPAE